MNQLLIMISFWVILTGVSQNLLSQNFDRLFEKGKLKLEQEEYQDAIEVFSKIIKKDAENAEAYFQRGISYNKIGKAEKAFADFTKAVKFDTLNIKFLANHAYWCIAYTKNYSQAIDNFSKIIEINPEEDNAYFSRGYAYEQEGDYDKAIIDYTHELEKNPKKQGVFYRRALTQIKKQDTISALNDFDKTIQLDSSFKEAFISRGKILLDMGLYRLAFDDFNKALNLNPEGEEDDYEETMSLLLRGLLAMYKSGDSAKIEKNIEELIVTEPQLSNGMKFIKEMQSRGLKLSDNEMKIFQDVYSEYGSSFKLNSLWAVSNIQYVFTDYYETYVFENYKSVKKKIYAKSGNKFIRIFGTFTSLLPDRDDYTLDNLYLIHKRNDEEFYVEPSSSACQNGFIMVTQKSGKAINIHLENKESELIFCFEIPEDVESNIYLKADQQVYSITDSFENNSGDIVPIKMRK